MTWDAPTDALPNRITIYQTVPQRLSDMAISNVLAIGSFKRTDGKLSKDGKTMRWQDATKNPTRTLEITPGLGLIRYSNNKAIADMGAAIHDVPDERATEQLALDYALRVEAATNQLAFHPRFGTDEKRSHFARDGKATYEDIVAMRGLMFSRQIDGIRFAGASGRGGFAIEFGNDAKVSKLHLNWCSLKPVSEEQTATPSKILSWVQNGSAVLSADSPSLDEPPRRLTVKKITPLYLGGIAGESSKRIYPFALLDVVAETGNGSNMVFYLNCPIISLQRNDR